MKHNILLLFILLTSVLVPAQEDYAKYKPVEPVYTDGGVANFYEYLTNSIDFEKVKNENDVIIGFVLDANGKMNHIKVGFCSSVSAEKEIKSALEKAKNWDMSNQKSKDMFVCFKMKLIFSENQVKGLTKTMWIKNDLEDIPMQVNEFKVIKEYSLPPVDAEGKQIYSTTGVEQRPEYPGGIQEFYKYIANSFRTPNNKDFKGGKMVVQFIIEKDGSITEIKVINGLGFGTEEEAKRVLLNCKKWLPAMLNNAPVRCSYTLPLTLASK